MTFEELRQMIKSYRDENKRHPQYLNINHSDWDLLKAQENAVVRIDQVGKDHKIVLVDGLRIIRSFDVQKGKSFVSG